MKKLALAVAFAASVTTASAETSTDKIGFIYVGPTEDFGYNMSMDLGRLYLEQNLEGIETTAFEAIPETAEVERVMERLIQSGHGIIFATSYGYLDYAISLGEKYPDVAFLHAGGLKTSDNVGMSFPPRTGPLRWPREGDGEWLGNGIRTRTSSSCCVRSS